MDQQLAQIPGVLWNFSQPIADNMEEAVSGVKGELAVKLYGDDLRTLFVTDALPELRNHPYFVGCQFHPEFKSRPMSAHPLFARFVRAALERQAQRDRKTDKPKPGESTQAQTPQASSIN